MSRKRNLVCGWGVNDADYNVFPSGGKMCKFYDTWKGMLSRCLRNRYNRDNAYYGCCVSDDWKYFSNFKAWMEQQKWEGRQLDKDLLVFGNKIYSPNTCMFVPKDVNMFMIHSGNKSKGDHPFGVYFNNRDSLYYSQCNRAYLGCYNDPMSAHIEWQKSKISKGKLLAAKYTGEAVLKYGIERAVQKIQNDYELGVETLDF